LHAQAVEFEELEFKTIDKQARLLGWVVNKNNVLGSICVLLKSPSVVVFPGNDRPKWQDTTTVPLMATWFSGA
jgi:hypothetical protein